MITGFSPFLNAFQSTLAMASSGRGRPPFGTRHMQIPRSDLWKEAFQKIVRVTGSRQAFVGGNFLSEAELNAHIKGVLPLKLDDVRRFRDGLGGMDAAINLWIGAWCAVVAQAEAGERGMELSLRHKLAFWRDGIQSRHGTVAEIAEKDEVIRAAVRLERLLTEYFRTPDPYHKYMRRLIGRVRWAVPSSASVLDDELEQMIRAAADEFLATQEPRDRVVFELRVLAPKPETLQDVAQHIGLKSKNRVNDIQAMLIARFAEFMSRSWEIMLLKAQEMKRSKKAVLKARLSESLAVFEQRLNDREKIVFDRRVREGRQATLHAIGKELGCSRETVRKIESRLIQDLRILLLNDLKAMYTS